jgi:gliding motility-associated-like protein
MSATSTPAAVCSGTPVTLSVNPAGGAGGYSVNWMPGSMTGTSQNITPTATTTYTATVTDANGCTLTATTTTTIYEQPSAVLTSNVTSGCTPVCVNFSDNSTINNPGSIASWSWEFGDNNTSTMQNPSNCYTTPGTYDITLTVTSTDGCSSTIVMTNYVSAFAMPVADFTAGPQPTTIFNPILYFTDNSTNAASWLWSFGDSNNSTSTLQNPSFAYSEMSCFQVVLTVTSANGCVDTAAQNVCVEGDVSIYVPNAFTPNSDTHNDIFLPMGDGLNADGYELLIFDRWGNLIFSTNDITEGWNGTPQGSSTKCQEDTYVWKLSVRDQNGNNHRLIGKVSLIR